MLKPQAVHSAAESPNWAEICGGWPGSPDQTATFLQMMRVDCVLHLSAMASDFQKTMVIR